MKLNLFKEPFIYLFITTALLGCVNNVKLLEHYNDFTLSELKSKPVLLIVNKAKHPRELVFTKNPLFTKNNPKHTLNDRNYFEFMKEAFNGSDIGNSDNNQAIGINDSSELIEILNTSDIDLKIYLSDIELWFAPVTTHAGFASAVTDYSLSSRIYITIYDGKIKMSKYRLFANGQMRGDPFEARLTRNITRSFVGLLSEK